jgi:hypothetical protein
MSDITTVLKDVWGLQFYDLRSHLDYSRSSLGCIQDRAYVHASSAAKAGYRSNTENQIVTTLNSQSVLKPCLDIGSIVFQGFHRVHRVHFVNSLIVAPPGPARASLFARICTVSAVRRSGRRALWSTACCAGSSPFRTLGIANTAPITTKQSHRPYITSAAVRSPPYHHAQRPPRPRPQHRELLCCPPYQPGCDERRGERQAGAHSPPCGRTVRSSASAGECAGGGVVACGRGVVCMGGVCGEERREFDREEVRR